MMKEKRWQKGLMMMMAGFMAFGVASTSFAASAKDAGREPAACNQQIQKEPQIQPDQAGNKTDKNKSAAQKEKALAVENNKNTTKNPVPERNEQQNAKAPARDDAKNPAPEEVASSKDKKAANVVRNAQKEATTAAVIKTAAGLLS
jgi:hypothetical protein